MKKYLALLLSAVLLLSIAAPAAFAVEYADTYETAVSLAKNDPGNLDNLEAAVTMLEQTGFYGFSRKYLLYFQQLIAIQREAPDLATAELLLGLCQEDGSFTADLAQRGFPSCSDLLTYIEARKLEESGKLREALGIYSRMSVLDATDRAAALALKIAHAPETAPAPEQTAAPAPVPFSALFGLPAGEFAARTLTLSRQTASWIESTPPQNLSAFPLSADEVVRLHHGLSEGAAAPERDGRQYRLTCNVDEWLAGCSPEAYVMLYTADGTWADDVLTQRGARTWTFSAPDDRRFAAAEEIRASWDCSWANVGSSGWNESLTAELSFREGEDPAVRTVLELRNCAFTVTWIPGVSLGGADSENSVAVYLRDWQTGKGRALEYSVNTGRLIDSLGDPPLSPWEKASVQPTGHRWGDVSYDWSPDCRSCTARRTCGVCGFEETETAAAVGSVTKAATCREKGTTAYTVRFENSAFETRTRSADDVPMTEHRWIAATYTAPETCSVCGQTRGSPKPSPTPAFLSASLTGALPGQCSQRTFSSAYASSEYAEYNIVYRAGNAISDRVNRPWVEGVSGSGVGEKLTLCFSGETTVQALDLWLGYAESSKLYYGNNRPSRLRFGFSDGRSVECDFRDNEVNQKVLFNQPVSTSYIEITILDVYKGSVDDDTCIYLVKAYG